MSQQATVVTALAATGPRPRIDRWFYITVAVFVILLSVVGFGPSIIDQSRRNGPLTLLVIAHAIVAGTWLVLFLMQATLIATRRIAVHRRLGLVGLVLAVVTIVLGSMTIIEEFRRGHDLSGDIARAFVPPGLQAPFPAKLMLFALAPLFNFSIFVGAALWWRHRPDIHKRLMLLAVVGLAREPILHLLGYSSGYWPALQGAGAILDPVITTLLLTVSAIYDKVSLGRIHPVSLWIPILMVPWLFVLGSVVFPSVAWRQFAAWLIR